MFRHRPYADGTSAGISSPAALIAENLSTRLSTGGSKQKSEDLDTPQDHSIRRLTSKTVRS